MKHVQTILNKRVWNKTDQSVFCEKNVTNFTRHIARKHKDQMEVAKYEAFQKGSEQRKFLADSLRKHSNFLNNVEGNIIKPVRRPYKLSNKFPSAKDYLPCSFCYGMFTKIYLSRHIKICKNNKKKTVGRSHAQVDVQNMLVAFSINNNQLAEIVFLRMASDEISFVSKSDTLITAFGTRYFKCLK